MWSRNIKNGCSIYIYDISRLRVNFRHKNVWLITVQGQTNSTVLTCSKSVVNRCTQALRILLGDYYNKQAYLLSLLRRHEENISQNWRYWRWSNGSIVLNPAMNSLLLHSGYKLGRESNWNTRAVFLKGRAAARYRALASIIPGREWFSWNLSF